MLCIRCGSQCNDDAVFCPVCGNMLKAAPSYEEQSAPATGSNDICPTFADKMSTLFGSNLFMAVCILFSAASAVPFLTGTFNVFSILVAIFSWLAYSSARSGSIDHRQVRRLSGTVFAYYVVMWVVFGLLAFSSVVMLIISFFAAGTPEFDEQMIGSLSSYAHIPSVLSDSPVTVILIIAAVIMVISVIIILLINLLCIKPIHTFLKSTYKSIENNHNETVGVLRAKNAFLVFAVFKGISAILNVVNAAAVSIVTAGALCAAYIIIYVLLDKAVKGEKI